MQPGASVDGNRSYPDSGRIAGGQRQHTGRGGGVGAQDAVTPLGKPLAASVTPPVNPATTVAVMVSVTLLP